MAVLAAAEAGEQRGPQTAAGPETESRVTAAGTRGTWHVAGGYLRLGVEVSERMRSSVSSSAVTMSLTAVLDPAWLWLLARLVSLTDGIFSNIETNIFLYHRKIFSCLVPAAARGQLAGGREVHGEQTVQQAGHCK